MAIFNITNNIGEPEITMVDFRTDNINIHIDTLKLKISQHQITDQEYLGNF